MHNPCDATGSGWLPRVLLEVLERGIARQRGAEAADVWGGTRELRGGRLCPGRCGGCRAALRPGTGAKVVLVLFPGDAELYLS